MTCWRALCCHDCCTLQAAEGLALTARAQAEAAAAQLQDAEAEVCSSRRRTHDAESAAAAREAALDQATLQNHLLQVSSCFFYDWSCRTSPQPW